MQHLDAAINALIDAAVETVMAGFDEAADAHRAMRARGEELRQRTAAVDLLGPALSKLAQQLVGEIQRRAVPRYAAMLRHVRYSADADINELEDARRTLNGALLTAQRTPDALRRSLVMLAIIRVRAITIAVGAECVAAPIPDGQRSGGPVPRRREIGPDDIPVAVARIVVAMARDRAAWAHGLEQLQTLETDHANAFGLVSSIGALAEQPGGQSYIRSIAARIERAGIDLQRSEADIAAPPAVTPAPVPLPVPAPAPPAQRPAPAPPPASPQPVPPDRSGMLDRFGAHLARAPDARALLSARQGRASPTRDESA
jgi:hypothetical protein